MWIILLWQCTTKVCCGWAVVRPSAWSGHPFKTFYSEQGCLCPEVRSLTGSFKEKKYHNCANQSWRQLSTTTEILICYGRGVGGGAARRHLCASELERVTREEGTCRRSWERDVGVRRFFSFPFVFFFCVCWTVRKFSWYKYLLLRERAASVGALLLSSTSAFCCRGGTHRPLALCSPAFPFTMAKK